MKVENLRVWDPVISRLEYLSAFYCDAERIVKLFRKSGRAGLELLRFDVSPIYAECLNQKTKQTKLNNGGKVC